MTKVQKDVNGSRYYVFKHYTDFLFGKWKTEDLKEYIGDYEKNRDMWMMDYVAAEEVLNVKHYLAQCYGCWEKSANYPEGAVGDPVLYTEWQNKEDALQELHYRRELAHKHQQEANNQLT